MKRDRRASQDQESSRVGQGGAVAQLKRQGLQELGNPGSRAWQPTRGGSQLVGPGMAAGDGGRSRAGLLLESQPWSVPRERRDLEQPSSEAYAHLPEGVERRRWETERAQVARTVMEFTTPRRRRLFRVDLARAARVSAASEFGIEVAERSDAGVVLALCEYVVLFNQIYDRHMHSVDIGVVPTPQELEFIVDVLTMNWFRFGVFESLQHLGASQRKANSLLAPSSGRFSDGLLEGDTAFGVAQDHAVSTSVLAGATAAALSAASAAAASRSSLSASGTNARAFALAMLLVLKEGVGEPGKLALAPDPRLAWMPSSELVKTRKNDGVKLSALKRSVKRFVLSSPDVCLDLYPPR